jgi:hypothetical protein
MTPKEQKAAEDYARSPNIYSCGFKSIVECHKTSCLTCAIERAFIQGIAYRDKHGYARAKKEAHHV